MPSPMASQPVLAMSLCIPSDGMPLPPRDQAGLSNALPLQMGLHFIYFPAVRKRFRDQDKDIEKEFIQGWITVFRGLEPMAL